MEALLIKQSPYPTHAQRKETNKTHTHTTPKTTTQNPKPLILLPHTLDLYFLLSEI